MLDDACEQTQSTVSEIMVDRETALFNFYSAERRAGATPLEANERMHFFAKRLDALRADKRAADDAFNRDLAVIRQVMERA